MAFQTLLLGLLLNLQQSFMELGLNLLQQFKTNDTIIFKNKLCGPKLILGCLGPVACVRSR
jgi:hypothetical protein